MRHPKEEGRRKIQSLSKLCNSKVLIVCWFKQTILSSFFLFPSSFLFLLHVWFTQSGSKPLMVYHRFRDVTVGTALIQKCFFITSHRVSSHQNNWQRGRLRVSFEQLSNLNAVNRFALVHAARKRHIH